ncbi:sodium:solute symporter family protein [Natribacillus halophilus]|uniref:Solute:Na+ symporter, SSS family n=1 Tax=Natribacillus halophilus TaxID=549003 RepID=A0A1G8P3S4_9BACI|nr:sodium:solute symporter family protein [Natribacillus halophilus]SDI87082.1 solute:Na+ symporter, SSS family [Natribacillus halophilus]
MNAIVAIIATTFIVLTVVGSVSLYVGKKKKGEENWTVAGRSLPLYVIVGTQFASAQGGGMLVAQIGIGYDAGWSAIMYGSFVGIGLFLLVILAKWLRIQRFATIPEIFIKLYGNHKVLVTTATIMTIIVPFGWVCTQLVAFGSLFSEITGLSSSLLIVIFAGISLIFILPAGLASVAWTDFIFGCMMVIMAVASVVFAINLAGGWDTMTNNVPQEIVSFPEGLGAAGLTTIALWALSTLPGTLTNQMYYLRIFSSKNVSTARWSLGITAIVIVLSVVWASIMGMSIRSVNPNLADEEMAAGWFLTQLPIWFLALYSAFIIASIMSTISSAVQSVVANITRDIYKSYINPSVSEKSLLKLSRRFSILILILGIVLSIMFPGALDWLVATYAYSASGLLVPIFLGFALKNTRFLTQQGVIGSIIMGILGTGTAHIIGTNIPYAIFGLVTSLLGILVISFFTKNKSKSESAHPM